MANIRFRPIVVALALLAIAVQGALPACLACACCVPAAAATPDQAESTDGTAAGANACCAVPHVQPATSADGELALAGANGPVCDQGPEGTCATCDAQADEPALLTPAVATPRPDIALVVLPAILPAVPVAATLVRQAAFEAVAFHGAVPPLQPLYCIWRN